MTVNNIPTGYRFRPSDEELITYFLYKKATGQPLPEAEGKILERSLYGEDAAPWEVLKENDPWEDLEGSNKKIIYVFSRLIPKNGRSKNRVSRTTGCGTWEGKAVGQEIKKGRHVIGQKRAFTFKPKKEFEKEMERHGHWIMHEFSFPVSKKKNSDLDEDYVVCRITKDFPKAANVADFNDDLNVESPESSDNSSGCKKKLWRVSDCDDDDDDDEEELLMMKKMKKKKGRGIGSEEPTGIFNKVGQGEARRGVLDCDEDDDEEEDEEEILMMMKKKKGRGIRSGETTVIFNTELEDHRHPQVIIPPCTENQNETNGGDYLSVTNGLTNADDNQQFIDPPIADPNPFGNLYFDRFMKKHPQNFCSFVPDDDDEVIPYSLSYGISRDGASNSEGTGNCPP